MSELKDYSILDIEVIDDERFKKEAAPGKWVLESRVYLKSEADKVITELEEKLKNSRNARKYWRKEYLIEYKECCNQKYKRCLANAWLCKREETRISSLSQPYSDKEFWEYASDYGVKWRQRWLKIAENFK